MLYSVFTSNPPFSFYMPRLLYHIGFWASFTLLFVYQNPEGTVNDYLSWFWILSVAAAVVYTNLYYLLPKFFFPKKYIPYAISLLLLLVVGSYATYMGVVSDKEILRSNFFQGFINLFFFVVITSSLRFYRGYQRKQARLIKVENEQLKTELKLLKAQVNPHFLFNTLSNLYGLILHDQNEQAAEITLKLSDLMRYLLKSSSMEKVRLSEEIKFLEDYLSLEKIRLSHNLDIQLEVSGLDEEVQVAPLLFIPLVENTFKHGLQTISEDCFAHFTLAKQGRDLFFEAHNSIGQPRQQVLQSGTGLNNLRKRLALIYPNQHILEIAENEADFKASLQITI